MNLESYFRNSHFAIRNFFYADTNAMTMKDTSTKTTFIYEGLTEGTKYFFAVKARNAAGESAFSTVANRRTY